MLTSIEQKLSAIKAINESKEQLEEDIARAIRIREVINSIESVTWKTPSSQYDFVYLPMEVQAKLVAVLDEHFAGQRRDLIAQAEQLMK